MAKTLEGTLVGAPTEDAEDLRDALEFLQAFTWEVREHVRDRVRSNMRYSTVHPEPSEEEITERVDAAVESELQSCGQKLATLLMKGIS